jgi:hypothetical protein
MPCRAFTPRECGRSWPAIAVMKMRVEDRQPCEKGTVELGSHTHVIANQSATCATFSAGVWGRRESSPGPRSVNGRAPWSPPVLSPRPPTWDGREQLQTTIIQQTRSNQF